MPRFIVTHGGLACLWSEVVDAPVSNFVDYHKLREEYPHHQEKDISEVLAWNRAGPDESHVALAEDLLKMYEDDGHG